MKRLFLLLSLAAALFSLSACHYEYDLSVDAYADLSYENGDQFSTYEVHYDGFHQSAFSDSDLEYIFTDLIKDEDPAIKTAILYLKVYDDILGEFLRDETYGVVYDSRTGHYSFADLNARYWSTQIIEKAPER